jgi:hypothetical protein
LGAGGWHSSSNIQHFQTWSLWPVLDVPVAAAATVVAALPCAKYLVIY